MGAVRVVRAVRVGKGGLLERESGKGGQALEPFKHLGRAQAALVGVTKTGVGERWAGTRLHWLGRGWTGLTGALGRAALVGGVAVKVRAVRAGRHWSPLKTLG